MFCGRIHKAEPGIAAYAGDGRRSSGRLDRRSYRDVAGAGDGCGAVEAPKIVEAPQAEARAV